MIASLLAGTLLAGAAERSEPAATRASHASLPLVVVTTRGRIRDEPKVGGTLRIVDNGAGRRNRVGDPPAFRARVGIEVRGDHRGVNALTQRLELGNRRVEVDERGVTGGYLLELTSDNQARGERRFITPITRRRILYTDPNRDELSAREVRWLRGYVGRFERALYRGGEWRRYLDVPAAVDYALLQELFKNEDAFYSSTYLHKGRGAKLAFGPV